jgi:uncharacterized protein YukE
MYGGNRVAGFYGADVAQLRSLAKDFQRASQSLQMQGQDLTRLVNGATAWTGNDAQHFRSDWNGSHRQTLLAAARILEQGSERLRANADQQEQTSSGSPQGTSGSGNSAGTNGSDSPGASLLDWGKNLLGVGLKVKDMVDVVKDWSAYLSTKKILDFAGDLRSLRSFSWADDFVNFRGAVGPMAHLGRAGDLIGKWGRFAGPALAPLSIFTGISDMVNPEHGGWRGVGDQVAGGLGVLGGVGSIAMAAGLLANPVGIGIVVGAGLVAGGWALGNMIADSEWGKDAGRWISDTASDAWDGTKNIASDAWDGAKDAAGDAVDGAKKFLSNPVSSLGGLFG